MDAEGFAGYLNDHLGGSEAALKIVDRLIQDHPHDDVGAFAARFRDELHEERAVLRAATDRLGMGEGLVERGVGALGGMAMRVRDALPVGDAPTLVEDLESLAVGVWGKRLMWGTVARAAAVDARLSDIPVDDLAAQAEEQERALLALRGDEIERALRMGSAA